MLRVIFFPQWLDNPYQNLLAEHLEKLGVQLDNSSYSSTTLLLNSLARSKPDVLHLHALHPFFLSSSKTKSAIKLGVSLGQLVTLRLLGIKIVWTAHNLKNHENKYPTLDRIFTTLVVRLAHGIIAHGETAKQEVIKAFSLREIDKIFVIPHGNYFTYYENNLSRIEARKALNIPDTSLVLLFLGLIRPYKGVLEMIDAFRQLHQDGVQLVIAGKLADKELAELINQKVKDCSAIKFIPGFVADEQIQVYMNACDAVVLPYRDILTSGSIILAMSFSRACIAPRKGCIGDVLDDSGAFLYDPDMEKGLLQAMNHAIQHRTDLLQMGERNRQLAEQWGWNRVAEMTLHVYQQCFNS